MNTPHGLEVERSKKALNPDSKEGGAQVALESAGQQIRSPGYEYLGSWAVHFYQNPFTSQLEFLVQQNVPKKVDISGNYVGITEQMAIIGAKEIERVMKSTYRGK